MVVSDARPLWLTPQLQEDIYYRWRELMVAVYRHGGLLVAHAKWQGFYKDMMLRLAEDKFWINGVRLLPDQSIAMMFRTEIPEDDLFAWTPTRGIQKPSEFFGNIGFGRLGWKAPNEDGIQPWETAKIPEGQQRDMKVDNLLNPPEENADDE